MLKKAQGTTDVDASRILEKGPEFLRKQMERESDATKARVSAVERLAATRPQYVKSQQEPAITVESASVSSQGSGINADSEEESHVARRSSSKKRDSVLLYRQKCELRGSGSPGGSRRMLKKSLFAFKDKTSAGNLQVTLPETRGVPQRILTETRGGRRGVARSSSDISSRYSKNFADFDAFFKYCGLDGDVVESMGRENFSARSDDLNVKIRSVSTSTSDGGFSRSNDGPHEEELQETVRQGSSVVERNARIIKWLYSCRNAAESGKTLRDLD